MIPKIYDKNNNYIGELSDCLRGLVIEERNGMFELEIDYRLFHKNYEHLVRGNIIEADANDKLPNQLFRIYKITKDIQGQFSVYAKHISYDIARDYTEGLTFENQSCEYCLNELFRNSQFSQKFIGHSDIVNAQKYSIGNMNLLTAIAGARGSILDTFGKGAEILRDNYDFHVLNKRGHDNDVVIEYASNLTGLDYEEDDTDLVTRIRAIAKYTPSSEDETESQERTIYVYVDSPNINKYETPFISEIDFSDKFEDGKVPTVDRLRTLAEKYFEDNKCDLVKFNYKISFIPLSKCVGYEGIEDRIDLCDTVTVIDYRYGLNTKAKVIKATYDFLRNRYDSMELGEPRTTLGDVVGGTTTEGTQGPPGPQGPQGEQGPPGETTIPDFPDTVPATPILKSKLYGFSSIELSWTFENKVYYTYEVYASKIKGFTPNTFDLIHEGQTSSYLFQAEPGETWYFKVCGKNTYGNRTTFSDEVEVTTKKIDDLSNYVSDMAIGDALIGDLSLDRGWVGQLNASLLDVKGNFSVTDGNGKRTLDIDSFGNVYLDVAQLSINSSSVAKESYVDEQLNNATNDINTSISSVQQTADKINWIVKSGTSSSNMSLTSDALNIISNNINLSGKVTFSSFNSSLQTQINGISNSANSAVTTANNAASTANSVESYVDRNSEDWDAAYNQVYYWSSGYPTSSNITTINGGYIETGSITADKIAAGTISVDMLKSNNANPIIRLFGSCALDATARYETGQGTSIRLKWNDENYIMVATNGFQFYTSNGGESSIFTVRGDTSSTQLSNQDGYTLTLGSSLSYRGSTVLTTGNYSSYCAPSSHSHSGYASSSHSHSGYASSSHSHGYQDRITYGNTKLHCYNNYVVMDAGSCHVRLDNGAAGYGGNYKLYCVSPDTDLGTSSYKWRYVFSRNALQTSDIKYKENIQYLDDGVTTFRLRGRKPTPFLDFMRDSFRPATYDYKVIREEEGHVEADRQIGFIANDIIDNEIGQTFLYNYGTEEETDIMFSPTGYTTVVARALQEEIQERESRISELEARIELLESKLNEQE